MKASKSLRRPINWQDFESLCKKLWGEIWRCPEIQKNGRTGQNQSGVDISGIPDGEVAYYGIQCKGKDLYTNKQFTEKEILKEINSAKGFAPALKKFYLATTAVKDAEIEAFVRQKNIEHKKAGLFEIHLFSWEDIVDLIDENPNTYNWYVNSNNYKTNKKAIVTFQDGSDKVQATVKFRQIVTNYRQKILTTNPLYYNLLSLSGGSISGIYSSPFEDKINHSYYPFRLRVQNVESDPIERFKIFFELEGEFQKLKRYRNWSGMVVPKHPIPYDTFLNEDERGGEIIPRKDILVSEDMMTFDSLGIKPLHTLSTIIINWRLTSKDYKAEGILTVSLEPEIIREERTVLVEDPFLVKVEEGEIEDYITTSREEK